MKLKSIIIFAVILFSSIMTFAVPANKTPITIKQPNGKTLTFILQGDERISWASTLDNYSLLYNKNGNWVYAVIDDNGDMIASDILACNKDERSQDELAFLSNVKVNLFYSDKQVDLKLNRFKEGVQIKKETPKKKDAASSTSSTRHQVGNKDMLIILVNFQDKAFTFSWQDFNNKYNVVGDTAYGATGSLSEYYNDCSQGRLNINFTVVGPYTLPNTSAYYSANASWDKVREMARDAVMAADSNVDFSNYDSDGDGNVDFVHIIYAGMGRNITGNMNEIWPHSWFFSDSIILDGVGFVKYSCSNEIQASNRINGIGTAAHEIGHDLGLPDFYDTDYSGGGGQSVTLGEWELMDAGSYNNDANTPPYINSYAAYNLGWIDSLITLSETQDCLLSPLNNTNHAYNIDLSSNESLIIEQRKKIKWDLYTPGEGMLIYHLDSTILENWWNTKSNTVNINPSDRGLFIEPATGVVADAANSRCTFPGSRDIRAFTSLTDASPKLKDGTIINAPVTHIKYTEDSLISFKFKATIPQIVNKGLDNYFPISNNQAMANSQIVYTGLSDIIEKGVMWSIDSLNLMNYSWYLKEFNSQSDLLISTVLDSLVANNRIYYRPFISNSYGYDMGEIRSFIAIGNGVFGLNDSEKNNNSIKLYPNPASQEVNILSSGLENAKIIITDIQSKEIKTINKINSPSTKINISDLSKGIYFVRINNIVEKLIIN